MRDGGPSSVSVLAEDMLSGHVMIEIPYLVYDTHDEVAMFTARNRHYRGNRTASRCRLFQVPSTAILRRYHPGQNKTARDAVNR